MQDDHDNKYVEDAPRRIDELSGADGDEPGYLRLDALGRGERLVLALDRLILLLERARLAEYIELMQHKRVLFRRSFFAGLFRGMGMAVGFLLLGALALYLLNMLADLGIPILGDFIAELLVYVEGVQSSGVYRGVYRGVN